MDSNVYLVEDIAAILRGIALAHADVAKRMPPHARTAYSEGFAGAIHAIALALHIIPDFDDCFPLVDSVKDCDPDENLGYYVVPLGRRESLLR